MVVENPLSDEQEEALEQALESSFSGSISDISVETNDGTYDYSISCRISQPGRVRSVSCKAKWHTDVSDWEIGEVSKGAWRS